MIYYVHCKKTNNSNPTLYLFFSENLIPSAECIKTASVPSMVILISVIFPLSWLTLHPYHGCINILLVKSKFDQQIFRSS